MSENPTPLGSTARYGRAILQELHHTVHERRVVTLASVVLIGTVLRLYQLNEESLWLDEYISVVDVSTITTRELLMMSVTDTQMPLYLIILRGWTKLFGISETSVRLPSVIFSIATIVVLYLLATQLYDRWVGLLSAVFLALSPYHLYFAQEARNYALFVLLTALSYYWFVQFAESGSNRAAAGYLVTTVLLTYTHVFSLWVLAGQNVYAFTAQLLGRRESRLVPMKRWIGLQTVVGIVMSPWLLTALSTLMPGEGGGGGTEFLTWLSKPGLGYLIRIPAIYFQGYAGYSVSGLTALVLFLILVGCALLAAAGYELDAADDGLSVIIHRQIDGSHESYLLGLWLNTAIFVPFVASYLLTPMFVGRYTIPASLALFVLVAAGVANLRYQHLNVIVAIFIIVALLATSVPMYFETDNKEQWDEATNSIEANADADDLVVLGPAFSATDRTGFEEEDLDVAGLPIDTTQPFPYYFDREDVAVEPVTSAVSEEEIQVAAEEHNGVWIVFSHMEPDDRERILEALKETHEVVEHRGTYGGSATNGNLEVYYFERGGGNDGS